jgi:predicted HAD superfamily hydrolase
MSRDEVTKFYFNKINKYNNCAYVPVTVKEANKLWWRHTNTKSWRLTEMGFVQFYYFEPNNPIWEIKNQVIFNGKLIVALEKLRCPWYCRILYNSVDKFWMLGNEESVCMAMCNADLHKFLETWEY